MNQREPENLEEPKNPARLEAALRHLFPQAPPVPAPVDEHIFQQARQHLAAASTPGHSSPASAPDGRPKRPAVILAFPRWANWAAAAAVVLLATLSLVWLSSNKRPTAFARKDLNRDGRIDILDAFILGRQLQQGPVHDRSLDFDGDGRVDQQDINTLAEGAVRLERRRG